MSSSGSKLVERALQTRRTPPCPSASSMLFGVDDAAVAQHDALLGGVEGDVRVARDRARVGVGRGRGTRSTRPPSSASCGHDHLGGSRADAPGRRRRPVPTTTTGPRSQSPWQPVRTRRMRVGRASVLDRALEAVRDLERAVHRAARTGADADRDGVSVSDHLDGGRGRSSRVGLLGQHDLASLDGCLFAKRRGDAACLDDVELSVRLARPRA